MTKFYFFMAIFTAVICNVVIKAMMEIKSVGSNGELEPFTPASYLTLLMAFGMFFALPWHIWQEVLSCRVVSARVLELISSRLPCAYAGEVQS